MMNQGLHLTAAGTAAIIGIYNSMNKSRPFEEKYAYLSSREFNINDQYVQGFVDAEGHFSCYIGQPGQRGRSTIIVACTLEIAQATHEVLLLQAISLYLGLGYIKPSFNIHSLDSALSVRSVSRLVINQNAPIIDLFTRYPLLTLKQEDFLDWATLSRLQAERAHHTTEGLAKMKSIKAGMNLGRPKVLIPQLPPISGE